MEGIMQFEGTHCETTATGTLLKHLGIELSEPMLFGLGEGLGFIFWNMKGMDFPFIGGRIKPDLLTANIAKNLNLVLKVKESTSQKRAWEEVKQLIDRGQPVGLKMDCYHLDYFANAIHFAGHYATIYGYDNEYAYLIDTVQQGGKVKTTLESLARARAEKGPMSSKNLYYTLEKGSEPFDLKEAVCKAIAANARDYLNPPISNIGYRGIKKTSVELLKVFKNSKHKARDFCTMAMLMERAGTGGALFRNLYADFLKEAKDLLDHKKLEQCYIDFVEIAGQWTDVSTLLEKAGKSGEISFIEKATLILKGLSEKEQRTFLHLLRQSP